MRTVFYSQLMETTRQRTSYYSTCILNHEWTPEYKEQCYFTKKQQSAV